MADAIINGQDHLNERRILVKVIRELSGEMGFDAQFLSEDWIISLKKGSQVHYIYGYEWGLNSAAAQLIAKDKAAAWELLDMNNVKAIPHKLFFNYFIQKNYTGQNGSWDEITRYVQLHKKNDDYNIVCKPNRGTGGDDVYRIRNQLELENTVQLMFSKYRDFCLCPFYDIEKEYRIIFLKGQVLLVYLKERPFVRGNGEDSLVSLIINKYGEKGLAYLENLSGDLGAVLKKDEEKIISWKHNLGAGARALIIEEEKIKDELSVLAGRAAGALDINFASVDIVLAEGEYHVMEINSGMMIESFARQAPDENYNYYEITKDIYRRALKCLFD